jgi:hypothetical protein
MDAKKFFNNLVRFTLLDHLLEFCFWALAIVGLVLLGSESGIENSLLVGIVLILYILIVTAGYFFIVKKIKAFLRGN